MKKDARARLLVYDKIFPMHPNFLTATQRLIVLGLILLIAFGSRALSVVLTRRRSHTVLPAGAPREYGLGGGAVCPRCRRPFPLGLMDMKVGFGYKFAPCPFCGKWSIVRRLGVDELRLAEAAELAEAQAAAPIPEKSEEEKLKDMLDESKYKE